MLTAIYDGRCVICNTTRRIVQALDWFNRVEFLDLHQQQVVSQRFPSIDHDEAMGAIHVIGSDGRVFAGFAGTRRMLRALPLGLPLYAILRLPIIGDWLGPKLYGFIARHRYAINRLLGVDLDERSTQGEALCEHDVCKIPTGTKEQ
ncbi:MAG: thiol-disulfide oxidoreductase DCC family protein [Chloroflexota bacterium]